MHISPSLNLVRVIIAAGALITAPLAAQIRTVDPNSAIDADLAPNPSADQPYYAPSSPASSQAPTQAPTSTPTAPAATAAPATTPGNTTAETALPAGQENVTWQQDDLIGAAEGVFGKGAQGLAGIIERTLKEQGQPVAYIAGREASGAIGVGLRYGSGTLYHKVEGQREVYWTGPSIGFDLGGNAANTFVLVYNLYDSQDLYKRFPAGEGAAYFVGGFNASYLRWGNVVLIPIRLGVGYRLGANIGYMKFTEKRDWLPF